MINTLLENDLIPDFLIRHRIRKLNQQRLQSEANRLQSGAKNELIDELKESDLTCSYLGVDKQIKYENDLMAIIQNTIAEDFTFI